MVLCYIGIIKTIVSFHSGLLDLITKGCYIFPFESLVVPLDVTLTKL
eukprot:UN04239